jgi:hypothetical protein
MKGYVFRDITPCSPFKGSRRFGGTCRFIQDRKISQLWNQWEAGRSLRCHSNPNCNSSDLTLGRHACRTVLGEPANLTEFYLLGYNAIYSRALLVVSFTLVSCLTYSSTLKMEVTCSSDTSVDLQRTTRRYIPEDWTLHNHRCENLKFFSL